MVPLLDGATSRIPLRSGSYSIYIYLYYGVTAGFTCPNSLFGAYVESSRDWHTVLLIVHNFSVSQKQVFWKVRWIFGLFSASCSLFFCLSETIFLENKVEIWFIFCPKKNILDFCLLEFYMLFLKKCTISKCVRLNNTFVAITHYLFHASLNTDIYSQKPNCIVFEIQTVSLGGISLIIYEG